MSLPLSYLCMYRNVLWHTMLYSRRDKLLEGGPVSVGRKRDVMSTPIKWTFIAQTYHHWHYVSLCVISSCHASSKHSIYSDVIYSIRWLTVVPCDVQPYVFSLKLESIINVLTPFPSWLQLIHLLKQCNIYNDIRNTFNCTIWIKLPTLRQQHSLFMIWFAVQRVIDLDYTHYIMVNRDEYIWRNV